LRFACSFEAPLVLEEVPGLFNHRPARWRGLMTLLYTSTVSIEGKPEYLQVG
jgi:hypothetical protein